MTFSVKIGLVVAVLALTSFSGFTSVFGTECVVSKEKDSEGTETTVSIDLETGDKITETKKNNGETSVTIERADGSIDKWTSDGKGNNTFESISPDGSQIYEQSTKADGSSEHTTTNIYNDGYDSTTFKYNANGSSSTTTTSSTNNSVTTTTTYYNNFGNEIGTTTTTTVNNSNGSITTTTIHLDSSGNEIDRSTTTTTPDGSSPFTGLFVLGIAFAECDSPPEPSGSQTPSPLAFALDPHDRIVHTTIWPDQCQLWNTEHSPNKDHLWIFNPYHYEDVCMNVKITGGYVLFIDFNDNNVIDGCVELLCSFYNGDTQLTTYQILDNELINANNDEWFSTADPLFSKAKAWRPSENTTHTMDELEIIGFHIRDYQTVQDDYQLMGQYADCKYVQDYAYWEAVESGWECNQLAMHHMRIIAFDGYGVVLNDGSFVPSYDFVFGYWEPEQVTNAKIVDSTVE